MKWFSRQHQKFIWKLEKGQWLGLCWCDSGLWGWSSAGSPQGDLGWLQTTNNHPHPLVLARGFHLSSKIFLLRWKTKVRERHLRPNFDEKQGTKSWKRRKIPSWSENTRPWWECTHIPGLSENIPHLWCFVNFWKTQPTPKYGGYPLIRFWQFRIWQPESSFLIYSHPGLSENIPHLWCFVNFWKTQPTPKYGGYPLIRFWQFWIWQPGCPPLSNDA